MHLHILGICGTFMGGIARLAQAAGHRVSGSDQNVYPPMSEQLQATGIQLYQGYDAAQLECNPDVVVVGNVMSRGMPVVEAMLDRGLPYTSGPQWLGEYILKDKWVIAVAGTHGKTTTSGLIAWILEEAGLQPGFLIGGVPCNFGMSARLSEAPFFVIEADEYDTAFFDKRSKFVHYRPRTLILNNLEYDHADIFPDLDSIKRQFHHLLRIVPSMGRVIVNAEDQHLADVLQLGCWTPREFFGAEPTADWSFTEMQEAGKRFVARHRQIPVAHVEWPLIGTHNVYNALAAMAAARHAGVPVAQAAAACASFRGLKRRMELRAEINNIKVYDDFAHHPTAIRTTLAGLRETLGHQRIIAVLEPRSNTMRMGLHHAEMFAALASADEVWLYQPPEYNHPPPPSLPYILHCQCDIESMVQSISESVHPGDTVLIMSNGGFQGLHDKLLISLQQAYPLSD